MIMDWDVQGRYMRNLKFLNQKAFDLEALLDLELLSGSQFESWKDSTLHNLSEFSRIWGKTTCIWKGAPTLMAKAGHRVLFFINNPLCGLLLFFFEKKK